MSKGDQVEHAEIDPALFDKAQDDPKFQSILARGFDISYDYDVPYLGGYSVDGCTIYIDRDTPRSITCGRRKIHLWPIGWIAGILTHEHWEKTAMIAYGWGYTKSHMLANRAEEHFVKNLLKATMGAYNAVWDPIVKAAENKLRLREKLNLPPHLDHTPYSGTKLAA